MSEIVTPKDMNVQEIVSYAAGNIIRDINSSDNIAQRRRDTIRAVRVLNDMWEMTGGERRIKAHDARFRGYIPGRDQGISIATGSIEGIAIGFEPWIYNDVKRGVVARYLIMLTVADIEGRLNMNGEDYVFTDGTLEYMVDLAHSIGPFEEVA